MKRKFKIARIEWTDIMAFNNKSRYSDIKIPINYTFGIIYKIQKINNIDYLLILRNINITNKIDDTDTDDIIVIPKGCVVKIKVYDYINLDIIKTVSSKEIKEYLKNRKRRRIRK